jgi:hypothetical protein
MSWSRLPALGLAALLVVASIVVMPREACAQSDEELTLARQDFQEALALQAAGDCAGALAKLQAVARVKMTPHVQFNIALCEERLGKLVAALGHYQLAMEDAEAAAITEVSEPARAAIDALEKRVPTLRVLRGSGAEQANIVLDGTSLGDAALGQKLRRDPGLHSVRAEIEGRVVFDQRFKLAEAEHKEIVVTVSASGPKKTVVTPPPVSKPSRSTGSSRRTLGYVIGGAGVLSLAAAGVFLVLRQDAIADLDDRCDGLRCPPDSQATIDRGRLYTGLAEAGIGLGVAGLVAGGVLVFGAPSDHSRARHGLRVGARPRGAGIEFSGPF